MASPHLARALALAALLTLALRAPAAAQPPASEPDAEPDAELTPQPEPPQDDVPEEVVVTGARAERRSSDAAVAVEVIRRQEIEDSGARDLGELLEERAGLEIVHSFRGTELRLRGLDPEYTLVLIDGERVAGRIGGAIDLSRFGVEAIDRVEIVRGPSSALYGSDAIGGVVNIVSRQSVRRLAADAMVSYGSRGVADVTGRVAYRPVEDLGLQLTGGLHTADALPGEGIATRANARRQWSIGGRAELTRGEVHRLIARADHQLVLQKGADTGAGGAVFDRTQRTGQTEASLSHHAAASERVSIDNRLSFSNVRDQYLVDQRGSNALDSLEDNYERLLELSSVVDVRPNAKNATTVGFEYLHQRLDSERLASEGRRTRVAAFAQHELRVPFAARSRLSLVPGLRLDVDSQFGTQLSPKLSVRLDATEKVIFRATYGRGFRAPEFRELLMRFENPAVGYVVAGNPDLGAERSHGVDVGVEYLPTEWMSLTATFFRNDLEGMIATVTVPGGGPDGTIFSYDNLASAWTMGVESQVNLRFEEYLSAALGYTFTEAYDGENERRIEGRARHRVTINPRLSYAPWQVAFSARASLRIDRRYYVDDDLDGEVEEVRGAMLSQVDLRLSKSFTRHLELFVGVENLLDAGDRFAVLRPRTFLGGARGSY